MRHHFLHIQIKLMGNMPEEQIGNFFVTCNKICEIVISYKRKVLKLS